MSKQLQELGEWKVGQEVIIIGGEFIETKTIANIEKITDGWGGTLYLKGFKYDSRGLQRSDGYHRQHLVPATEELKKEIRGTKARWILEKFKWHDLKPDEAMRIYKVLKENNVEI